VTLLSPNRGRPPIPKGHYRVRIANLVDTLNIKFATLQARLVSYGRSLSIFLFGNSRIILKGSLLLPKTRLKVKKEGKNAVLLHDNGLLAWSDPKAVNMKFKRLR
jgi:hypothetical protein